MPENPKIRASDPPDTDPATMRDPQPLMITVSRDDLAAAIAHARQRASIISAAIAIVVALLVGAGTGFVVDKLVTNTVRNDIGHAAVVNCKHGTTVGQDLNTFLQTDASFNAQLGDLDSRSARIDHDLSVQVAALGEVLPSRIAHDYAAQSLVYQEIAAKREAIAGLWSRGKGSVSKSVLGAIRGGCSNILTP